jgi:hypothetical protein
MCHNPFYFDISFEASTCYFEYILCKEVVLLTRLFNYPYTSTGRRLMGTAGTYMQ